MKILCVEDGSVKDEALEDLCDGRIDGKMLVYRQGATPPYILEIENKDNNFDKDNTVGILDNALELVCGMFRNMLIVNDYAFWVDHKNIKEMEEREIKELYINLAKNEIE